MENNLKIIHIADIHFGKKDDIKLYDELQDFINKIKSLSISDGIDMVCIEGDLYDRIIKFNEYSSELIVQFITSLCKLSNQYNFLFRIIKGTKTHDYNQLNVFKSFESNYPLFKIINRVETETIEKENESFNILYLPEEYIDNIYEYYSDYFNQEYDMILGHGMIDFVSFTGTEDENSERFVKNAPVFKAKDLMNICNGYVIFGHIHDFHEYKDKIYYCGSYSRFSFADTEDKGYIYTSVSKDSSKNIIEFYVNEKAPKYHCIDLDLYEFKSTEDKLKFINETKKNYDFIKIKTTKNEENIDILKSIVSSDNSIKMEIKNISNEDETVDTEYLFILNREYDLPTTIQKFLDLKYNKKLDLEYIKEILKPTL